METKKEISNAAKMLGKISTPKKAESCRRNAKKRWDDYRAKKKDEVKKGGE